MILQVRRTTVGQGGLQARGVTMPSGAGSSVLDIDEVLSILSRPDDEELAEMVELVAGICDSEAAGITIKRGGEYHVPIAHGIAPLVCPSDDTFCQQTMSTPGVFCVEDATVDPRFSGIGWVNGKLAHARFYASAPVYAPGGVMVGRLCVIDSEPKSISALQERALETLALSATTVIELRLLQAARVRTVSPEVRQTAATLMSQLAAELSHDLRVPLSAIVASIEMLEDELSDHPDRAVSALLASAGRAVGRMDRMLIQNMGFGTSDPRGHVRDVDLQKVAAQLVLDSAPLLDQLGAVVKAGDLPVVRADPDDMYSVLQNLLTNSLKFARPGVAPVVRIAARQTHGGWRIWVRDNGVGIPENRRVDVFSLFSRVQSDVAGHGIGLATVARIVSAHGGRVGAEPVPGGGTEIWFELPDADADEEEAG
jgi:signal transduction histidine kinase